MVNIKGLKHWSKNTISTKCSSCCYQVVCITLSAHRSVSRESSASFCCRPNVSGAPGWRPFWPLRIVAQDVSDKLMVPTSKPAAILPGVKSSKLTPQFMGTVCIAKYVRLLTVQLNIQLSLCVSDIRIPFKVVLVGTTSWLLPLDSHRHSWTEYQKSIFWDKLLFKCVLPFLANTL